MLRVEKPVCEPEEGVNTPPPRVARTSGRCGMRTWPWPVMLSAEVQTEPSGLTLTAKSSEPVRPISARPDQPVWNNRLAVSPDVALFTFTWWPFPSWVSSVAAAETASRFVLSAVVLMPRDEGVPMAS